MRRDAEDRREFPPELQQYDPADGWADVEAWWDARFAVAREHGTFGRTASGVGKVLPLLQEMARTETTDE
jgi:hypothetical protein